MKKITASILTTLLMLSMVFSSSVFAANEETSAWDSFLGLFSAQASADDVGVEYRGHIQNVGDYPTDGSWIQGPERLGTVGKSLRLEAFWIKLTDAPEGLHIKYEVHVQNIGWMDPVEDGKLAGTQGDSLRIEAIKISLVDDEGNVSGDYTVTYKGHIQNVGDTAWIKSGQQLGTTGSGLRLEALEVKIEKIAPDLTDYEAALAAVTEANYTKASWAAYQDVVEDNVMTEDNVQSEVDAATAIILDAQEDLVTVPVIAGMTATAQKQVTVTGTELSKLSAAMLTVANNTVTAVTPNADGTSAVVTLGTDLVPDTNTKVTATIDGTAKEYTVKYTIAATTVSIVEATYDNDLAGQKLTLVVNGVTTTVDYLVSQGYTCTFNAWNSSNVNVNASFFAADVNTTGKLATPLTEGTYTTQVTIAKGSNIATSSKATIKVANLDNNVSDITAYTINNLTTTADMTSSTLYVGETARVSKVTVGYGSAAAELLTGATEKYTVTSSNSAVITASTTKPNTLTAVGLGTADITITVGNATKVVTLTVVGTPRAATTVATKSGGTFTYIIGGTAATNTMTVVVKDQFGDPFVSGAPAINYTTPALTGMTFAPVSALGATSAKGEATIALTGGTVAGQSGNLVFRNASATVLGSATVVTSNENATNSRKLVFDTTSKSLDNTINTDLTSKSSITFAVGQFNSSGVQVGTIANLQGYNVKYNGDIVGIVDGTSAALPGAPVYTGNYNIATAVAAFNVVPKAAGTTTLTVTDSLGNVVESRSITVLNGEIKISSVSFKTASTVNYAGTINYTNVLAVEDMTTDDILTGVTLSTPSVFKVRIDELGTYIAVAPQPNGAVGNIYLDKDADGRYSAGDTKLGTLTAAKIAESGTWTSGAVGNVVTGQAVTFSDKGSVMFTVTDTVSSPNVVKGTSSVTVNVPTSTGAVITGLATAEFGPSAPTQTAATTEAGTKTWSSSNTAVATVNASTGVVTLAGAGTTTISYASTNGAINSTTLTVTPAVAPVLSYSAASFVSTGAGVKTLTLTSSEPLAAHAATPAAAVGAANTLATVTIATPWTVPASTYAMNAVLANATSVTIVTDAAANTTAGTAPSALVLGTAASLTDAVGNPVTVAVTVTP